MALVFAGGSEVQAGPQVEGTETGEKEPGLTRAKKMGLVIRDVEGQGPGLEGRDQAGKWSEGPLGSRLGGRKERGELGNIRRNVLKNCELNKGGG